MNIVTLPKTEYEKLLKAREELEELLKLSKKPNKTFSDSTFGIREDKTKGQIYEERFRRLVDQEITEDLEQLDW